MKLGDMVSRIAIDPRKLIEYALNPDNPVGRHKAYVFERALGFTKGHWSLLAEQVNLLALDSEAVLKLVDHHGSHYSVDLEITGLQGQQAVVCTGWIVTSGSDEARLTTLYGRKRTRS